jgi:hypothetical protein
LRQFARTGTERGHQFQIQLEHSCHVTNAAKRPQFEEILAECPVATFTILPNTDRDAIGDAVDAVRTWDERSRR